MIQMWKDDAQASRANATGAIDGLEKSLGAGASNDQLRDLLVQMRAALAQVDKAGRITTWTSRKPYTARLPASRKTRRRKATAIPRANDPQALEALRENPGGWNCLWSPPADVARKCVHEY